MEKATLVFHIYKTWQILKRFTGTFYRAQTLILGGVYIKYIIIFKKLSTIVFQRKMFYNKHVFCLELGSVNFPSISALIDFYKLNLSKPLPCYLTESPLAQRSA